MSIIDTKILPGATQGSNAKTLQSMLLLRCLKLDSTILAICISSYAARLSLRPKCYKTFISMRVVKDSGGYMWRSQQSSGAIWAVTRKSSSYADVDPKYPHP